MDSMKRYIYAVLCLLLGISLSFIATEYIHDIFISYTLDPGQVDRFQDFLQDLLRSLLIVTSLLFSWLIYLTISFKERTTVAATSLVKGITVSQAQFSTLYDSGPVPYLLVNQKGCIEWPNKAALRFFKGTQEQLEDTSFFSYLVTDEDHTVEQLVEDFKRKLPIVEKEYQIKRLDGVIRSILLSLLPLEQKEKKGYGIATLLDSTERKEIEKSKTEFVSLAAHQLRTPLSTLNWYTEMLLTNKEETLTQMQEKYISKLARSTHDMADLVNTLLNVSRIEMGKIPVSIERSNITDIAESVLDELTPDMIEKKLIVKKEYGSIIDFLTDPKLLRIILQNLVSNAVRYTPENGSITITITQTQKNIEVRVSDTGYGIPPEQQDKIFLKLFRADNARQKVANGNGLGLYMTKALVEALGGTITFTSAINKGTTFICVLPEKA